MELGWVWVGGCVLGGGGCQRVRGGFSAALRCAYHCHQPAREHGCHCCNKQASARASRGVWEQQDSYSWVLKAWSPPGPQGPNCAAGLDCWLALLP